MTYGGNAHRTVILLFRHTFDHTNHTAKYSAVYQTSIIRAMHLDKNCVLAQGFGFHSVYEGTSMGTSPRWQVRIISRVENGWQVQVIRQNSMASPSTSHQKKILPW